MSNWTLFSNHGHVLVCLARDSEARLRDVAAAVGITERAVQKIVRDLQESGMISVSKQGRRNQYRIHRKAGLRHELEADSTIGGLIDFVSGKIKTVPVVKKPAEAASTAGFNKVQKSVEPATSAPVNQAREPIESIPPSQVEPVIVKQKETADTVQVVKQKEAADTDKVVTKDKVPQKVKEKSEIEKQQGSLF